jgi:hypothetical protein
VNVESIPRLPAAATLSDAGEEQTLGGDLSFEEIPVALGMLERVRSRVDREIEVARAAYRNQRVTGVCEERPPRRP